MVRMNYKSIRQGNTKSYTKSKSSASMSYLVIMFKWGSIVPAQFKFGAGSHNRLHSTQAAKHPQLYCINMRLVVIICFP